MSMHNQNVIYPRISMLNLVVNSLHKLSMIVVLLTIIIPLANKPVHCNRIKVYFSCLPLSTVG
jgi:hypothetical protein